MGIEEILAVAFAFLIVVVPILGFTARMALKPIVEAIIRLRESFTQGAGGGLVERRVLQLEEELRRVNAELRRLSEAEAFQRELLAPPPEPTGRPTDHDPRSPGPLSGEGV